MCEENEAKQYCFDCKKLKLFCDEHLAIFHRSSAKLANHHACPIDEYLEERGPKLKKYLCNCPEKLEWMFYCQNDLCWICKCCAKWDHETHEKIPRAFEIQKDLTNYFKKLNMSFEYFEENMIERIKNVIQDHKRELLQSLDEIISLANILKEKIEEKSKNEMIFRESQFSIIKASLSSFYNDVENHSINPNKIMQINKFFNSKKEELFIFQNIEINAELEQFQKMKEIMCSLEEMKTQNEQEDFEIMQFKTLDEQTSNVPNFVGKLIYLNHHFNYFQFHNPALLFSKF